MAPIMSRSEIKAILKNSCVLPGRHEIVGIHIERVRIEGVVDAGGRIGRGFFAWPFAAGIAKTARRIKIILTIL